MSIPILRNNLAKPTTKLLNLPESKALIKCNRLWCVQKDGSCDGSTMGSSLAVILAILWLKEYEPAIRKKIKLTFLNEDNNGVCHGCQKKMTYRAKGFEFEHA